MTKMRRAAHMLSQRLIVKIAELGIPHVRNPFSVLTLSGGVSAPNNTTHDDTWLKVLHRADQALYQAKTQGRMRVVSNWSSTPPSNQPEYLLRVPGVDIDH
jgi:PleD family two-component response regulator